AHPRSEVAAGAAEHDHAPAGHVFATVIAHTFHHDVRAAVADAEPLARHAADIGLAAGRAVERDVADDDVLLGLEGGSLRRIRDHLAAREALAEAVVRVADKRHRDAARNERAEALTGRSGERDLDRVVRQPRGAVAARDFGAEHRADRAIRVAE